MTSASPVQIVGNHNERTVCVGTDMIIMTPYPIQPGHTLLNIVRVKAIDWTPELRLASAYIAEGKNAGIVINKPTSIGHFTPSKSPNFSISFRVHLINSETNKSTLEHRTLKFWFSGANSNGQQTTQQNATPDKDQTKCLNHSKIAHEFFTKLVGNEDDQFPKNYVGFIMRVMRLLKHQYTTVDRMELDLKQLPNDDSELPTSRSSSIDGSICEELNIIETNCPEKPILKIKSNQPVIAIITSQNCEKLAVDSMISNKDTYFRYKAESETSNYVYTLGNVGDYQVVSTKLPAVGNSRNALIAAGNTTTRLLGTFQQLEYIFLIGCSGGVANYTEFSSHVRLGDIVVSSIPNSNSVSPDSSNTNRSDNNYIYVHCEEQNYTDADNSNAELDNSTSLHNHQYRFWCPDNLQLQHSARHLWLDGLENESKRCWERYIDEGIESLKEGNVDASRPSHDTDKLYISLGVKDVIEVSHPEANENDIDLRKQGRPMCHFGPIGSGRAVVKRDTLRQSMIEKFGVLAFDSEFDAVLDSIYGNRKESFIFIRGVSDYRDGRKKKEWQQYSALVAAAFMKSIIINLSAQNPTNEEKNLVNS